MQSLENEALEEEWEQGRKKALLFAQSLATTQYDLAMPKDQDDAGESAKADALAAARIRAEDEMKRKAKEKEERMAAALAAAEAALEARRRAEAEAEAEARRLEEERLAAEKAAEWERIQAESEAAEAMLKDVLSVADMKAQADAMQIAEEDRLKAETEAHARREAEATLKAQESEKQRLAAEAAAAAEAEAEAERRRPMQEAEAAKSAALARLEAAKAKAKADAEAAAAAEAEAAAAARQRQLEEQERRRAQRAEAEARAEEARRAAEEKASKEVEEEWQRTQADALRFASVLSHSAGGPRNTNSITNTNTSSRSTSTEAVIDHNVQSKFTTTTTTTTTTTMMSTTTSTTTLSKKLSFQFHSDKESAAEAEAAATEMVLSLSDFYATDREMTASARTPAPSDSAVPRPASPAASSLSPQQRSELRVQTPKAEHFMNLSMGLGELSQRSLDSVESSLSLLTTSSLGSLRSGGSVSVIPFPFHQPPRMPHVDAFVRDGLTYAEIKSAAKSRPSRRAKGRSSPTHFPAPVSGSVTCSVRNTREYHSLPMRVEQGGGGEWQHSQEEDANYSPSSSVDGGASLYSIESIDPQSRSPPLPQLPPSALPRQSLSLSPSVSVSVSPGQSRSGSPETVGGLSVSSSASRSASRSASGAKAGAKAGAGAVGQTITAEQIEEAMEYFHSFSSSSSSKASTSTSKGRGEYEITLGEFDAAMRKHQRALSTAEDEHHGRELLLSLEWLLAEAQISPTQWFRESHAGGAHSAHAHKKGAHDEPKLTGREFEAGVDALCAKTHMPRWRRRDIAFMLRQVDLTGEGELSLPQLCIALNQLHLPLNTHETIRRAGPVIELIHSYLRLKGIMVRDIFNKADTDHSQSISAAELRHALVNVFALPSGPAGRGVALHLSPLSPNGRDHAQPAPSMLMKAMAAKSLGKGRSNDGGDLSYQKLMGFTAAQLARQKLRVEHGGALSRLMAAGAAAKARAGAGAGNRGTGMVVQGSGHASVGAVPPSGPFLSSSSSSPSSSSAALKQVPGMPRALRESVERYDELVHKQVSRLFPKGSRATQAQGERES